MRWRRVSAATRSAMPSAWTRSSFPLAKARRENSPGSDGRTSGSRQSSSITPSMTARLPCTCSSPTSSPVKLSGPGKYTANPSSRGTARSISRSVTRTRQRGRSCVPHSLYSASLVAGPEIRMTQMALGGGPLAGATIVSPAKGLVVRGQLWPSAGGNLEALHLLASAQVGLDDLIHIASRFARIPDAFRIDHHHWPVLASVQATRCIDPHTFKLELAHPWPSCTSVGPFRPAHDNIPSYAPGRVHSCNRTRANGSTADPQYPDLSSFFSGARPSSTRAG